MGLPGALNAIAENIGIPTIEIQHGLFDANTYKDDFKKEKPKYMFCWNDFSVQLVGQLGIRGIRVGHPFLGLETKGFSSKIESPGTGFGFFCVALSHGEVHSLDPYGSLNASLVDVIAKLALDGKTPVFRIHPDIAASRIRFLLLSYWLRRRFPNCLIENPRKVSLQESAMNAGFMLTWNSSLALDFAILGTPSICLDPQRVEIWNTAALEAGVNRRMIFQSHSLFSANSNAEAESGTRSFVGIHELQRLLEGVWKSR
jgi:hypothetical protein